MAEQGTHKPLVPSSNLGVATFSPKEEKYSDGTAPTPPAVAAFDALSEGAPMAQAARIVTPVAWLEAPQWLTLDYAAYLTGHTIDYLNWMIEDGCVESDGAGLIEKQSLHDFQESLLLVLHWNE
jgi:hypothetical protein